MSDLPPEAELYRMYDQMRLAYFSDEHGNGLIPPSRDVRIEWSNRLTASAGICYPRQHIIRLSTHYHRAHPKDVESTLLHEMIHLIVPGHGPEFHAWLAAIQQKGGRVYRYAKARATVQETPRWRYRCMQCGVEWSRYRRLRHGGRDYIHKGCGGRLTESRLQG